LQTLSPGTPPSGSGRENQDFGVFSCTRYVSRTRDVVWDPGKDTHESFELQEEQSGPFLLAEAARSDPIAGLPP
jgi:hypothetical protein